MTKCIQSLSSNSKIFSTECERLIDELDVVVGDQQEWVQSVANRYQHSR